MNPQASVDQRARVAEFQRKHRIGLLTLLFTDMVGSTQLKQTLGDLAAVALIQRHHSLIRRVLGQFTEAEEIGTAGDSFFIVFAKPSDAARFSLQLQAGLRRLREETAQPLADRIGIHIGEVIIEEHPDQSKDLYGIQIDTCARVMSLAAGSQILLSRSAFDNARQVLKSQDIEGVDGLSWMNHGPYLLKGVEEPVEICEVGEVGFAPLQPPAASEKAHRHISADSEPVLGWRPALGQAVPGTEWVLQEKLGEGGFGEVWLSQHQTLKERRVFKFCFRADRVRSLRREVTLFRLLKERVGHHPNIVGIQEVFFDEPPFYIVMDDAQGQDLRTWCRAHGGVANLPLEAKLEIVAQIAEALQAAHDAGIIHRDVKPSNILISGEWLELGDERVPSRPLATGHQSLEARLTDFGIGQVVSQEYLAGVTRAGFTQTMLSPGSSTQTGTHLYMAPELLAAKPASTRSDIYSLGVVLFQLVVGDLGRPLTTDWSDAVADPWLKAILRRCFAGDPQRRLVRAAQLAKSLRSANRKGGVFMARNLGIWASRHPWVMTGLGTLAVLGLIGAAYWLWEQNRALTWQRDHPHQVRPYNVGLFDSLGMGSTVFIVSFGVALLTYADFLDRRRRFRITASQLLLYGAIGAGQVMGGLYVLLKWIKAWTWGLGLAWYRYFGLVLMIAIPLCWLGLFLVWQVLEQRRVLLLGVEPRAEVKSSANEGKSRVAWVLLVESLVLYLVATFQIQDAAARFIFTFMALAATGSVWSLVRYRASGADERKMWLFLAGLQLGLLGMCIYTYSTRLTTIGCVTGVAGGLALAKWGGVRVEERPKPG